MAEKILRLLTVSSKVFMVVARLIRGAGVMEVDENDVFDESIDPYDRSLDCDYDNDIPDIPSSTDDDSDEGDEESWDSNWDDEDDSPVFPLDDQETDDYDEIDD